MAKQKQYGIYRNGTLVNEIIAYKKSEVINQLKAQYGNDQNKYSVELHGVIKYQIEVEDYNGNTMFIIPCDDEFDKKEKVEFLEEHNFNIADEEELDNDGSKYIIINVRMQSENDY